jgi:hypothetical protein
MKSYIKIYGPPTLKALRELEKIAVDMPQVCIMDTIFSREIPSSLAGDVGGRPQGRTRIDWIGNYYETQGVAITEERCQSIISLSSDSLGEYDFFFEWLEGPSTAQLNMLIEKIDKGLHPYGCYYTITTKK